MGFFKRIFVDWQQQRQIRSYCARVRSGASIQQLLEMKCPICEKQIEINFDPIGECCHISCFCHFARYVDLMGPPPEGWKDHVGLWF